MTGQGASSITDFPQHQFHKLPNGSPERVLQDSLSKRYAQLVEAAHFQPSVSPIKDTFNTIVKSGQFAMLDIVACVDLIQFMKLVVRRIFDAFPAKRHASDIAGLRDSGTLARSESEFSKKSAYLLALAR